MDIAEAVASSPPRFTRSRSRTVVDSVQHVAPATLNHVTTSGSGRNGRIDRRKGVESITSAKPPVTLQQKARIVDNYFHDRVAAHRGNLDLCVAVIDTPSPASAALGSAYWNVTLPADGGKAVKLGAG